ncbi:PAS domain S-box protein [Geobacter sp. DSM 9736]|uniref:PAS domain S-box protein n=1 Tax=Geobacter sp. DSM 9736 TaxID=1277350 RepID=UPI000B4FEB2A|nr:PAS domain S-box protein [Geobacter sp. DSM 9736]SNB44751.1 PAS domain S-box-containing protein [Geobacter sp. DSM 9736]
MKDIPQICQAIFYHSPAAIYLKDSEGRYISVNRCFEELFELSRHAIIGKTDFDLLPATEAETVRREDEQARQEAGRGVSAEEVLTIGGRQHIFLTDKFALRDEEGTVVLCGISREITEMKQREHELENAQERYALVSRATTDVIWDWDVASNEVQWNDAVEKAFGCTPDELGGAFSGWAERIHPQEREEILAGIEAAITGKADTWGAEYRFRRKDGSYGTFYDRGIIARDEGGRAVRMIGSMLDLTERHAVEEALRQSEAQFRQLTEALPQLVWITRPDGYHEYFNSKWHEFTGLLPVETQGELWSLLLHPDDYRRTLERWHHSLETGEPYEIEYRFKGANGAYHWFLGRALPLRDREGNIIRWFGTCTDIDPQKQAEEKLQTALDELSRSNRELEQFAYVASHDLQEPLRAVARYVELLALRYTDRLDEQANTYIRFAADGAKQIHSLIGDLLTFTRIGEKNRERELVAMERVVRQGALNVRQELEDTGGALDVDQLPAVWGNEYLLVQLVQNLLSNALKFRKPGTAPVVRVGAREQEEMWEFFVRDNGIGIEPRFFDRIFHIFQRLHTRQRYQGTGMGLAICKKIVEHHGGSIRVESAPGEGATFFFTLPKGVGISRERKGEVGHE